MKQVTLVLLAAIMLSACTTFSENRKQDALHEATLLYERSIRWLDFEGADALRQPTDSSRPASLKNIKVTSYRQVGSQLPGDRNSVIIIVKIDYYHADTLKVSTVMDEQTWVYDAENEAWHITSPLPPFR